MNYVSVSMKKSFAILLVPTLLMLAFLTPIGGAEMAIVYIDPPLITGVPIGETFPVNVTVAHVINLYAWTFQICYRSEVLNASNWALGPVFKASLTRNITVIWTDNYNATHGLIQVDCTFLGAVPAFNGTTTLAMVYFKVKADGFTVLHLQNTLLLDDSYPFPAEMAHTTVDGRFGGGGRDIAVTGIALSKNVANDTIVRINVTVANYGSQSETFNVTLYYDSTEMSTKTAKNLAPSAMLSLNLSWDTTPVPKGNYIITASAHPLPDEANTADNTYVDGTITETILGDVDGNFEVNILDISKMAVAFGSKPGDASWNPNADLDDDNNINILDISKAAFNFGKKI